MVEMNRMKEAFLSALTQRTSTRTTTTLPVGEVDTNELNQVLRALDDLPSSSNKSDV